MIPFSGVNLRALLKKFNKIYLIRLGSDFTLIQSLLSYSIVKFIDFILAYIWMSV